MKDVLTMIESNEFNKDIGTRIRTVRDNLGKTREQISEAAGISAQFLFYIETGRKSMSAKTIVNLAKALNVSTDYLLLGNNANDFKTVASAASSMSVPLKIIKALEGLSSEKLNLAEKFIEDFSNGARNDKKKSRHL